MQNSIDLKKAKKYRDDNKCTLVIVKDEEIIIESKSRGILPLFMLLKDEINVKGASAADKVIGLGAAMIAVELGIKYLHTYVISKSAYSYLQSKDIVVSYNDVVDFIANRNNDGACPVETMAESSSSTEELLIQVEQFLKRLELI